MVAAPEEAAHEQSPRHRRAAEAEVFGVGRACIVMHLGRPIVGVDKEDYQAATPW